VIYVDGVITTTESCFFHIVSIFFFPLRYISMNNLNDPPNWNIQPNSRADGGDGNRWNYALLVPMLGLAAFRKSWFS
jgi:hypothetical protein